MLMMVVCGDGSDARGAIVFRFDKGQATYVNGRKVLH